MLFHRRSCLLDYFRLIHNLRDSRMGGSNTLDHYIGDWCRKDYAEQEDCNVMPCYPTQCDCTGDDEGDFLRVKLCQAYRKTVDRFQEGSCAYNV